MGMGTYGLGQDNDVLKIVSLYNYSTIKLTLFV